MNPLNLCRYKCLKYHNCTKSNEYTTVFEFGDKTQGQNCDSFENNEFGLDIPDPYCFVNDNKEFGTFASSLKLDENKNISKIVYSTIGFQPTWLNNSFVDPRTKLHYLELCYIYKGCIVSHIVSQKEVLTTQGLKELTAYGLNVPESKTKAMADYFSLFISKSKSLTEKNIYSRFGWADNGCFVLGKREITADNVNNTELLKQHIQDKFSYALSSKGTVDKWIEYTKKILRHDRARLKCYAACTAPILKILNLKSFILHDYGETSTGKTKTSEVGMSIYGDPKQLLMTAFGTSVGKEQLATLFTDLPIFIDETQVSSEDDNRVFIYMIANETGKIRGLKEGGLKDIANWKTIAFTTGEAPLTTNKSFTGMNIRVIELYGGLGTHDKEAVDEFNIGVQNCYGVIAPYIIQEILNNKDQLYKNYNTLNKTFDKIASKYDTQLNGIGGRASSMFAVLTLGGVIFETVLEKLGGEIKKAPDICEHVYKEYLDIMANSGYSKKAYEYFISWINTKENYFLHDTMARVNTVPYDLYGNISVDYVDIYPTVLNELLEKGGFNHKRVLKDWQIDGTLIEYVDANGKTYSSHTTKILNKSRKVKRVKLEND